MIPVVQAFGLFQDRFAVGPMPDYFHFVKANDKRRMLMVKKDKVKRLDGISKLRRAQ